MRVICVLCARKGRHEGNTHSHFHIHVCFTAKGQIRHQNAEPIATLDHPALELARHQHCSDHFSATSFAATTPSVAPLAATALALAAAAIVTATITSITVAITAATIALATAAVGAAIPAAAT